MINYIHPSCIPSHGIISFALAQAKVRSRDSSVRAAVGEEILTSVKYIKRSRIVSLDFALLNGWTIFLTHKHHPI